MSVSDKEPMADTATIAAAIRQAWREAFPDSAGDPSENFFVMGGDSQTAVWIISSIESRTGVRSTLELLFERPTLGALIDHVIENANAEEINAGSAAAERALPPITPRPRRTATEKG